MDRTSGDRSGSDLPTILTRLSTTAETAIANQIVKSHRGPLRSSTR
jgi:hypothetical protein